MLHVPSRRVVSGLIVLFMLIMAGCGSKSDSSQNANGDSPKKGGTLVIGRASDGDSYDPQKVTAIEAAQPITMMYDTLVNYDYEMKNIVGGLAEKWEVSADGKAYTFSLKTGVKFHSGKPFTADDVKYTFERWVAKETASPTKHYLAGLKEVIAKDPQTVIVNLDQPSNVLLHNLAQPFASILNKDAVEKAGKDYGHLTVDGTGPYKFSEWVPEDTLTLSRNPDYNWAPPFYKNRGPAYLDKVVLKVIPEDATRYIQLEKGDLHSAKGVPNQYKRAKENPDLDTQIYPNINVRFLALKMAKPTMSDVRVRRALAHAINKEQIVKTAEQGLAKVANAFMHPNLPQYPKALEPKFYAYDPAKAKQLLDEAGWRVGVDGIRAKDGMKLSLGIYSSKGAEEELALLQADWKAVGVELKLNIVDLSALYAIRRTETPDVNHIFLPYDHADILYQYFHSTQRPAPNRFNFVNPTVDTLLATTRTATDAKEVNAAFDKLQEIVHDEAIAIPLFYRDRFVMSSKKVKGLRLHPVYDLVYYKLIDEWLQ